MKNCQATELLKEIQLLPLTQPIWSKFDISLYTESSTEEYKSVKDKIKSTVKKGNGGLYIITKGDRILYVGESEQRICNRLIRHIDKIYIKKTFRARFFKESKNQGDLTIFYLILTGDKLEKRKDLEELLTISLNPEYKKWLLHNRIDTIKGLYLKSNTPQSHEEKALEDSDFYDDDLDKDDMLDRLGTF